jgi:hypothetical protein
LPDDISLAILIQLFTGLPMNIIVALCWEDFRNISGTSNKTSRSQLVIDKYYDQSSKKIWLTDPDKCRKIPLMTNLTKYIARVKDEKALNDKELSKKRIIGDGLQIRKVLDSIKAEQKSLLQTIAKDSIFVDVPYKNGNEELDIFNGYKGNRFQKNFENRCLTECRITEPELQYLTMKKVSSVFYAHYVDFGDECIQAKLIAKLDFWAKKYIENESENEVLVRKEPKVCKDPNNVCIEYELRPTANNEYMFCQEYVSDIAITYVATKYGIEYYQLTEEEK